MCLLVFRIHIVYRKTKSYALNVKESPEMSLVCENIVKTMSNIIKYWDLTVKDEIHLLWPKDGESFNVDNAPKKITDNGVEYSLVAALCVGGFVFGNYELFNYLQESGLDYRYIIVDGIKNKVSKQLYIMLYLRDSEKWTEEIKNSANRIIRRTEMECTQNAINEMGLLEKTDDYKNTIHMLAGKLAPYDKSSATLPILSKSELIEQAALDFSPITIHGYPIYIYVNGKLLERTSNTERENIPLYSMISRISGISIAFAEEAYGIQGQLVRNSLVGQYIEVSTDDKPWLYYKFCVQELAGIGGRR